MDTPTEQPKPENATPDAPQQPQTSVVPPEAPKTPETPPKDGRSETSAENGELGGRPKGSISKTTQLKRLMRQILVQKVHDEFGDLMAAKFDLAKGHWVYITEIDPATGKEVVKRVYKQSPDAKSLEYLIDQVIGKPTAKYAMEEAEDLDNIEVTEEEQANINLALKSLKEFQKLQANGLGTAQ